ncbi:uncharacterized protein Dwil_GK15846 [Drosophila willistoni]|uniref:Uncharacterized protein n=1 Tax=Drosophila willistoni TaxID=7260 RepID=B4MRL6_DROWI|nr:uncharacterized protein LOC6640793 [Drosophila willistoni]EDW74755.1 uncharacterized protein Dwil_GK15846 [Drosophila willistoni]
MLRSRILSLLPRRRCISYFSNEFNNLANKFPESNPTKNLAIFVDSDHQTDFLDQLVKLRQQKECTAVPLFAGALVKQLLESSASPQEAISILRNPTQYGLFVDNFSGSYLIDYFLHNGHALEAAQVSALLVERGLCNSELLQSLCIQSFYTWVKDYKPEPLTPTEAQDNKVAKPEVEKVRVKFIRNLPEDTKDTEEILLGRALTKCATFKENSNELGQNIALLGFVLSGQLANGTKFLQQHRGVFHKEILQLCQTLVNSLKVNQAEDFLQLLEQTIGSSNENPIDKLLDAQVKQSVKNLEPKLLSEYTETYQEWVKNFDLAVKKQIATRDLYDRVKNIQNTLDQLDAKRQALWFYENKDDIDIQIFKKKIYYPKRWFGKKKKPKAVDTFYVPPNITRSAN